MKQHTIGLLGGTFNPIHFAHIQMAQAASARFGLSHVLFMVANDPPHKVVEGGIAAAHRYRMASLALLGLSGLSVSDLELRREGKSYTFDTVCALMEQYPDAEIALITGSDMLRDLPSWSRAPALMQCARFLCIARKGESEEDAAIAATLTREYGARIALLQDANIPALSSTGVRQRVHDALPIDTAVPPAVEQYIYRHGFYQPSHIVHAMECCRERLSAHRYAHSIGVMQCAIQLAHRYGVDAASARLAGLLHDYGRYLDQGALSHAQTSAACVEKELGITDPAVLRAIRLHTTLDAQADDLSKIIYLADMIEPNRDFPGVDTLRAAALVDLDFGAYQALDHTLSYLAQRGVEPDARSLRAYEMLSTKKGLL